MIGFCVLMTCVNSHLSLIPFAFVSRLVWFYGSLLFDVAFCNLGHFFNILIVQFDIGCDQIVRQEEEPEEFLALLGSL